MNRLARVISCSLMLTLGFAVSAAQAAPRDGLPGNLAPQAKISANSEYSGQYLAKFVADGKIPTADGKQDLSKSWAVKGETHQQSAELVFEWQQPVRVAEIIYYGRTAWMLSECWKDYAVHLDGAEQPAAAGELKQQHGPQRIRLPQPQTASKLVIRFTSSYNGANPGASEVQIFSEVVNDKAFKQLQKNAGQSGALGQIPKLEDVDVDALRELIGDLSALHGAKYARADQQLARLEQLAKQPESDERLEALRQLERAVLLFDVEALLVIKRHEIVATHVYTYHYEGFRKGGGLYVVWPHEPERVPLLLAESPEGQILDCDLSYDGKTALFSMRENKDAGYHLWRVSVDGSDRKQLTDGDKHDYNGCWLPDGGIAFLCTRSAQFAYCWHAPVGVVHRMNPDGTDLRTLSANYLNDFTPYPLSDGRILYSRWEYVDKPAIPIQSLWTINPDGTNLTMYFGNGVLSPGTFMEPRPIPGTQKIVCTMTGHNGPTRGAIGVIDRGRGLNSQAAITNITPDTPLPNVNEGNGNTGGSKLYSCPQPLDGKRLLVSAKGPLLVRTFDGDCASPVLEAPAGGMQYFNAQPVRPRPRPPSIPSTLPARNALAATKHPRIGGEDAPPLATLYLQDVYNGLEPHVKRGEIKRLRVVREMAKGVRIDPKYRAFGFQFPVISCGATYAGKDVLGEVPVRDDGSVTFRVPANVPLYFIALDEQGRGVQRMRSFTHLMPGEVQGCIGCHDRRLHTSRSSDVRASAYGGKVIDLDPPEWGRGGFDYTRVVQPVLDKHCVECHNPQKAPRGIDLTGAKTDYFNVSYDVLARENQGREGSPFVNWIPTYNGHEQNILEVTPKAWGSPKSKLAEVVLSGHPDKDGKARHALAEYERRRILAWIDLNVPYYGNSETAYPEAEGCRRMYPQELDAVLKKVADSRCAECHKEGKIPRRVWTRVTEPEFNDFLLAPLAKDAGGTGKCGKPVFLSASDPDYQAILATFNPVRAALAQTPRMDMPGAKSAPNVCRDTK